MKVENKFKVQNNFFVIFEFNSLKTLLMQRLLPNAYCQCATEPLKAHPPWLCLYWFIFFSLIRDILLLTLRLQCRLHVSARKRLIQWQAQQCYIFLHLFTGLSQVILLTWDNVTKVLTVTALCDKVLTALEMSMAPCVQIGCTSLRNSQLNSKAQCHEWRYQVWQICVMIWLHSWDNWHSDLALAEPAHCLILLLAMCLQCRLQVSARKRLIQWQAQQ